MTEIAKRKRGKLIAIEGAENTGKRETAIQLCNKLKEDGIPVIFFEYPRTSSSIGKLIHHHMKRRIKLSDETLHLLLAANRWENNRNILSILQNGINIIITKYTYTSMAYSIAKGLSEEFCASSDIGLVEPDMTHCLTKFIRYEPLDEESERIRLKVADELELFIAHITTYNWSEWRNNREHWFSQFYLCVKEVINAPCDPEPKVFQTIFHRICHNCKDCFEG